MIFYKVLVCLHEIYFTHSQKRKKNRIIIRKYINTIHSGVVTGYCSRSRAVTYLASFNLTQASFTSI